MIGISCAPDLPVAWADHDRLEQVFVNLLGNAVRHNPAGTRVRVRAEPGPHGTVVITVTDDGAGLPAEVAAALFQPRRGPSKVRTAGAGLGLSIARGIVTAHGGLLTWCRFRPGPASRSVSRSRTARPRWPRPTCRGPRGRERWAVAELVAETRALVVEDDPNIVDLIRSNLAVRGFDTVVSADGARALQLLDTEEPDIVLLDLMLPEADGFELCRLMRERSGVAIIVVSARGGERDKVTALNMGADDYLTSRSASRSCSARISATLRRTRLATAGGEVPQLITVGELRIDLSAEQVFRRRPVHLTPTEFALLRELATNRGKLLDPRAPAAPGLGTRLRDRDRVRAGLTSGGCGPSWKTTAARR